MSVISWTSRGGRVLERLEDGERGVGECERFFSAFLSLFLRRLAAFQSSRVEAKRARRAAFFCWDLELGSGVLPGGRGGRVGGRVVVVVEGVEVGAGAAGAAGGAAGAALGVRLGCSVDIVRDVEGVGEAEGGGE